MNTAFPSTPRAFNLVRLALAVGLGLILGVAAIYVPPLVALGTLATLFLVILMLRRPDVAILGYLILTSTFLSPAANVGVNTPIGHVYVTDILLIVLLAMIPIRTLVEPGFHIVHTPLDLALWGFVAVAYLSTTLALVYTGMRIQQSLAEMRVVASYLLFFAVTNLIRERRQLKLFLIGVLFLACLVGVAMVVQYIRGPSAQILPGRVETLYTEGVGFSDITRVIPPGDSIVLVGFIAVCTALWVEDSQISTVPGLIAVLSLGLGVLFTFKRHYWVAVVVDSVLIALLYRRRNFQRVILSGIAGVGLLAAALFFVLNFTGNSGPRLITASTDRFGSLLDPNTYENPASSLRWRDFENFYAIPQIEAHPLLGIGLGSFYRPLVPPRDWALFDGRGYIHNGHLWLLTKIGVLGYLPFMVFVLLGLIRGFRFWRSMPDGRWRSIVLGLTLGLLAMLIGSWVEPELMEAPWTPVIGVLLGVNELILSGVLFTSPVSERNQAGRARPSAFSSLEKAADV